MKNGRRKRKITLDPNAPGLDEETRARRRSLAALERMSIEEVFQLAVRAGIFTKSGQFTKHYRDDPEPKPKRRR